MKVEDAATANTGIWITFIGVVILYIGLGVTTILVLRMMSRRFREGSRVDEADVPYGPSEPASRPSPRTSGRCSADGHHRRRHPVRGHHDLRRSSAAPTSAPASGTSSPAATKRGERPREVIDHSIAPVWEANHVWLIFVFVLLWTCFPEAYASITLTLFVPLTLAALGIVLRGAELRVPQGGVPHPRPPQLRRRLRRSRRSWCPTAWAPSSAASPRGGSRPGARPATRGTAGSTRRPSSAGVLAVCLTAYLAAFFLVRDAGRLSDEAMVAYFRRRATGGRRGRRRGGGGRDLRAVQRRRVPLRRAHLARPAAGDPLGGLRPGRPRRCSPGEPRRGARLAAVGAVASVVLAWGVAQWDYLLPESLTVSAAAAPSGTITAVLVATGLAVAPGRAGLRAALRARPEDAAARGEHARAHAMSTVHATFRVHRHHCRTSCAEASVS